MATPAAINQPTHGDKGVGAAYTSKHALVSRALVLFLERGRHPPLTRRSLRTKLKSAKLNANLILVPQGKLKTKAGGYPANLRQKCDLDDAWTSANPLFASLAPS
jgi:hypothetical protein